MTRGTVPHTSATIGQTVGAVPPAEDENALPPRPGLGVIVFACLTGAFVALAAMMSTAAVLSLVYRPLPTGGDIAGAIIFFAGPVIILLILGAHWWRALRSRAASSSRWVGLAMPGFAVLGVVAGVAFIEAALPMASRGALDFRDHDACQAALAVPTGDAVDACLPLARACQTSTIAAGDSIEAFHRCVRQAIDARP